jgi:hypothetical protein
VIGLCAPADASQAPPTSFMSAELFARSTFGLTSIRRPGCCPDGGGAGSRTTITKPGTCGPSERSIFQPARPRPPPLPLPLATSGEMPAKPKMKLEARSRTISFALSRSWTFVAPALAELTAKLRSTLSRRWAVM